MGWKMAQSKLKNKIIISIYEDKGKIEFKEHPTGFQLMAAKIILQENLDFNFMARDQVKLALRVYDEIQNVEEVPFK